MFTLHSIFLIDVTQKVQMKMKQEIKLAVDFKYTNIIPIYKLPDNRQEIIVNDDINKMIEDNIFASDEEHEINNVPNYDLFNKDVFVIF